MKRRRFAIYILMCMTLGVCAQTDSVSVYDTPDSDEIVADASVSDALQPEKKKGCWFGRCNGRSQF